MGIAKLAGLWELGWNTPLKELELWEYIAKDFGVEEFYMTPVTGIYSNAVTEKHSMQEILDENKDMTKVYVDENGEVDLVDFKHPENALYVFGKAGSSPVATYASAGDLTVRIRTVNNKGLLWPHQAATLILYDRMLKEG